ncbi:MAG: NAD(P)/FAD-dependent oxidoreductase [Actinomycetes bacterium]
MTTVAFDLVIVGAGPAGTAAALGALAVRPAARVALVDRAAFPRDKVCGDGLTTATVAVLDQLGVGAVLDDARPVEMLSVTAPGGGHISAPLGLPAYVLDRRVLDAQLVTAAVARGAQLIQGRVREIAVDRDRVVVDGRWSTPCVIGADGANSVVRAALGLPRHPARHTGVALRGYAPAPPGLGRLDIRFVPGRLWPAYGWAFDAGLGQVNVGVGTFDATGRPTRAELTGLLGELFGHLTADPGTLAGHRLPLSSGRPLLGTGRVLLAGDAAGLVDPLTGEGIHTALRSGMLAGRAAVTCPTRPLTTYRRAVQTQLGGRLRHLRWAARAYRHPQLIDALVAAGNHDSAVAAAAARLVLGDDRAATWARVAIATAGTASDLALTTPDLEKEPTWTK